MQKLYHLLDQLWAYYVRLNPHAQQIHDMLDERGESVTNDHIAFRTYDDPRVNIDVLARPFVDSGYEQMGQYTFTEKKLDARHYEHPEPTLPKVFISQLQTNQFSPQLNEKVQGLIDQIPESELSRWDLPVAGRPWEVSYQDYEAIRNESEYASWLAAFGFCANHFTVLINALKSIEGLEQFNQLLKENGFELNTSGGEIKGSPDQLLEQSSTLGSQVEVNFSDGPHMIPGCYYEFARRYPGPDGKLFQGFITKSADRIFESTDRR